MFSLCVSLSEPVQRSGISTTSRKKSITPENTSKERRNQMVACPWLTSHGNADPCLERGTRYGTRRHPHISQRASESRDGMGRTGRLRIISRTQVGLQDCTPTPCNRFSGAAARFPTSAVSECGLHSVPIAPYTPLARTRPPKTGGV
jgi:hypothetical protein